MQHWRLVHVSFLHTVVSESSTGDEFEGQSKLEQAMLQHTDLLHFLLLHFMPSASSINVYPEGQS